MSDKKGKSGATPSDAVFKTGSKTGLDEAIPPKTKKPAHGKGGSLSKQIAEEVQLTRRLLVSWLVAAGGTAATAVAAQDKRATAAKPMASVTAQAPQQARPLNEQVRRVPNLTFQDPQDTDHFSLLRPRDLLVLNISLVNMKATGRGASRVIKRTGSGQAVLLVEHQPQAIVEYTAPDTNDETMPAVNRNGGVSGTDPGAPGPIHKTQTMATFISGPSRLAYLAPDGFTSMPFTVQAILDACANWKLNLDIRAFDPPAANIMPSAHEFDRICSRLNALSAAQKSDLHTTYGPKVEALLRRIAKRIADAILLSADAGRALSTKAIDDLIDYEIRATLHPDAPMLLTQADPLQMVEPSAANLYVATVVTQQLSASPVLTQTYTREGMTIAPGLLLTIPTGPIGAQATDIEVPYRMHMTPLSTAGFAHATDIVDQGGRFTELWHTRMGTRVSDWVIGDNPEPLRALYADDEKLPPETGAWALNSDDRKDMVKLMSALKGDSSPGQSYTSRPAMAKHLRLTALGASLDAEGMWPDHGFVSSNIEQWKHISSIGRDQFVRVIYAGYLFPFGHAASLVKVSERKFTRQPEGGRVAGLMQKYYIIVRERVKTYPGDKQRYDSRDFPFSSIEITTKQTPDLKAPAPAPGLNMAYYENNPNKYYETFWPQLMNAPFGDMLFPVLATDTAGRKIAFDMPLMFVAGTRNDSSNVEANPNPDTLTPATSNIEAVCQAYNVHANTTLENGRRKRAVNNALIRFSRGVDSLGKIMTSGESDYHAAALTFEGWKSTKNLAKGPRFYPRLAAGELELPAIKNLLGTKVAPSVSYHKRFLDEGFNNTTNPAQIVFGFGAQSVPPKPSDKFGGMIDPGLMPDGLSRKLGVLSNTDKYLGANFDPVHALSGATLLGVIPLGKLLDIISFDSPNVPQMKTVNTDDAVVTTYTIEKQTLNDFEIFVPLTPKGGPALSIKTTVMVSKSGLKPDTRVDATLRNFKINLFGFIILNFDSLSLKVKPGSKTDVSPALNPTNGVMFGGPLEFLNSLRDVIPMDGFSDPPGLDISPNGITASYSLGLPDIGVGAMSLQNVNLGAGFDLPFTGEGPSARFNFAERHNPFNLTISLFGGGGFFAITVGSEGVRELEASLEFGAQISIDLGVASGGVYVKAGFYFHWQDVPSKLVQFEGYIEMGGHLTVLGLITVSLTFHLGLTYEKTSHSSRLYGTATLTVEIDILFFSISQDITVERQFAGSDADPAFIEFAPLDKDTGKPEIWNSYCAAFA